MKLKSLRTCVSFPKIQKAHPTVYTSRNILKTRNLSTVLIMLFEQLPLNLKTIFPGKNF